MFDGGYHGAVFGFAGGGSPINAPFDYAMAPYNDIAATQALIEANAADLALVILEPMMGSGGCIAASHDFLRMLRQETTRAGALLVLDEVMTSRLAPGGLQAVAGVKPDLTTFGKYIGGGMSFGAFGGRAEIMDLFDPRRADALPHAGTFNNNVLTMAAGLTGLTQVYTPDAAQALNARGDALRQRLNALCQAAGAPIQFTGIGSMLSVHTVLGPVACPADAAKGDPKLKELFFFDMLSQGIWLARRGMMALSLPIGDAECDRLATAVEEFLSTRRSCCTEPRRRAATMLTGERIREAGLVLDGIDAGYRGSSYDVHIEDIIADDGALRDSFKMPPQGIVQVISRERVRVPTGMTGLANVKTGLCNEGLLALNSGVIDPGYEGRISSFLLNFSNKPRLLTRGEAFLRLQFMIMAEATATPPRPHDDDAYIAERRRQSATLSATFLNLEAVVESTTTNLSPAGGPRY